MHVNVFSLVHYVHQEKAENTQQEPRRGVERHIPPPEPRVVITDLSEKQGSKHKPYGGQLQLRRNVDSEAALKQQREEGDGDNHGRQKCGEPSLAPYCKERFTKQYQLQSNGNPLVRYANAHRSPK